jgi:hypothetical protein
MITENYEITEKTYERFIRNNCINCEKYVFTEDCKLDWAFIDYFDDDYFCGEKPYFNFNLKDWIGEEQLTLDSKCLHLEKENKDRAKEKIPNKETLEAMRDIKSGENYETITLDVI